METLSSFVDFFVNLKAAFLLLLKDYIDGYLLLIIVFSAYWFRKNITSVLPTWSMAHRVLLWSTIITILYAMAISRSTPLTVKMGIKYGLTYTVTTSFYEIIFDKLEPLVTGIINWLYALIISKFKPTKDESTTSGR